MSDDSNEIRQASLVMARAARVIAYSLGMHAENMQRERRGESIAYTLDAFERMVGLEGVGENSVILTLRGER